MLHHERLRPPSRAYPADEWNVIEKRFAPEFLAPSETMLTPGNGYLGMRPGRRRSPRLERHLDVGKSSCGVGQLRGRLSTPRAMSRELN
jgi:hypothetical protein